MPNNISTATWDEAHRMHAEREAVWDGMFHELATTAMVDMLNHANDTVALVDSYGAACIWIGRLERELTQRGFILDPEVAFNAAHFELGVRQARGKANA
jgi:hypothetical protein